MKKIPLLLMLAGTLPLVSCNTTGDPMEGGLFGWSETKFDQRVQQKEQTLRAINSDTRKQYRTADGLRDDIDYERSNLRRYQ